MAKAHDMRYHNANNIEDIRDADMKMLKKVAEIERNKQDYPVNIAQAKLIKAKVGLEDLGLLKRTAFSRDFTKPRISSKLD